MNPIRVILHPTDFSESSGQAFELACSLAQVHGARLVLLYVAERPTPLGGEAGAWVPPALDLTPFEHALERLKPCDPEIAIERRVLEGEAARVIIAVAGQTKCDLIVMGTHGRIGLRRVLMGSVAEQVVRHAPCPVMTVKTPLLPPQPADQPCDTAGAPDAAATR